MIRLTLYTREKSERDAEEGAGHQHRTCCSCSSVSSSPSHSRLFPSCLSRLRCLHDVPIARRPDAADAGEILEEEPSYVLKGENGKFLGSFPLGEWGLGSSCERRRESSVCWRPALCQALEHVSSGLMCITSLQDDRCYAHITDVRMKAWWSDFARYPQIVSCSAMVWTLLFSPSWINKYSLAPFQETFHNSTGNLPRAL